MTHTNHNPDGAFQRIAAKVVFGNRPLVLLLFALMTLVMGFYASQLRVDAGFKKQIPLQHEYMKTFLEYERERSEEHTSELQSLMRISYAVFCLKKKKKTKDTYRTNLSKLNRTTQQYNKIVSKQ